MTRDSARSVHGHQEALTDTAELLDQERAARVHAEQLNALKDKFLGLVAHELRSPLGVILGWVHILRRHGAQDEFDKGLEVIESSVQAQVRLIENLLDISRLAAGQVRLEARAVEARGFIDTAVEALAPAARAKEIAIRKVLDLAVGPVWGEAARLQQVMLSLLSNAVNFTPDNGSVEVGLRRHGEQAEIWVSDNGIGIDATHLPHLFDPFDSPDRRTEHRVGKPGFGLAIASQLVELHGGELLAESPGKGRGATFTVRLPLAGAHSTARAPA